MVQSITIDPALQKNGLNVATQTTSTGSPRLEKQHRSEAHLSERLSSPGNHACPIEDTPPETPQ